MIWTNYHTHCNYCDGKGPASDYLEQATQRGLAALGFSSHAPVPFENDFAVRQDQLPQYVETIRGLKRQSAEQGGPQVYLGLEIDFVPGLSEPRDASWDAHGLDYKIGSVHGLRSPADNLPFLAVDSPLDEFRFLLDEIYSSDSKALVRDYYGLIVQLCQQGGFDILGHYDLVKKNSLAIEFLDESAPWYREVAIDTLDEVAKAGVVMETNSGGLARGALKEIYPAAWLLKEACIRKIPLQINADAHRPEHVDYYFEESLALVRAAGYREVRVLLDNRWQDIPI